MIKKEKKVFYWSPFTSKVATVFSVINSAQILNKYLSKSGFVATIIDAVKEWDEFKKEIGNKILNNKVCEKANCFDTFISYRNNPQLYIQNDSHWTTDCRVCRQTR